jgi:hypothetical protein
MFLSHVNVGWPLLDEGTRIESAIAETRWRSDSVADQDISHTVLPGPQPGFVEQVYEHVIKPDGDGRARARLLNDRLRRGFELDYDPAAFPAFFEWLNLREGAYAVGLEPSTHHVAGDAAARADGSMIWLARRRAPLRDRVPLPAHLTGPAGTGSGPGGGLNAQRLSARRFRRPAGRRNRKLWLWAATTCPWPTKRGIGT